MSCAAFDNPAHRKSCETCRAEFSAREELARRLRALRLPAPAGLDARLRAALPRRSNRWIPMVPSVAAAAALVVALFLFAPSSSEPVPDLVRGAADVHDRIRSGRLRPEDVEEFRRCLPGVVFPDASKCGRCPCSDAAERKSTPCIVYRAGGTTISLLVFDCERPPQPSQARRVKDGREYYAFRCGENTVLLRASGPVCHVWISSLDEPALLEYILGTDVGRRAFSGERITLRGAVCRGCCETLLQNVRCIDGVCDVEIDTDRMDLVFTRDPGKADLKAVIDAIRRAGFEAKR